MFVADVPDFPATAVPTTVLLAETSSGAAAGTRHEHVLGMCELVNTHHSGATASFSPVLEANSYYFGVKRSDQRVIKNDTAEVRVLQQPQHGRLEMLGGDWSHGIYLPELGYLGNDIFVVEVKGNGQAVKIKYFLRMVNLEGKNPLENKNCKDLVWKISNNIY